MRETFILHFESGLSYPDIAEQLGISYDNVRKRISQARAILRRRFNENFGEDGTDSDLSNPKSRVSPQSAKGKKSQNIVEKKPVTEEIEEREIVAGGEVQEPVLVNTQSDGDIGEREIVAGGEVQEAAVCVLHRGAKDYSPLRILANSLGDDSEKAIAPNAYSRVLSESGESQKALGVQVALQPAQAVVPSATAIRCIPSFSTPENQYLTDVRSPEMRSRQRAGGISRQRARNAIAPACPRQIAQPCVFCIAFSTAQEDVGRQWRRLAFFPLKNRQAENRFKSVFTADCFPRLRKAKIYCAGGINAAALQSAIFQYGSLNIFMPRRSP